MQVKKRTRLEIVDTEKRYYSNFKTDQTDNGINLWKLFVIVLIVLTLTILFIMCCRYIGQIVYIVKRCLVRRNGKCNDDSDPIIKESNANYDTKQRFSWPAVCEHLSKFHAKRDGQWNKKRENKCKLKTLLQERKKLLAPNEHKNVTTNNVELKKRLSLKMRFSAFSPTRIQLKDISNVSDADKDSENYECDESGALAASHFYRNSYEKDRDICFSDSDLKFLVIPLYPKRSRATEDELLSCKWDSGNVIDHPERRDNTGSKLIELTFENADSFSDTTRRYGIPKSNCTPCSLLPKDSATDPKCFSDSAVKKIDTTQNVFLNKWKRPADSFTTCALPSTSRDTSRKCNEPILMGFEVGDCYKQPIVNVNRAITDKLVEVKSKSNFLKSELRPKKVHKKMSSDVVTDRIREIKNSGEDSKSDEGLIRRSLHDFISGLSSVTAIGIGNDGTDFPPSDYKSEINDVYDELGMLFSHHLKLQTQPCERKYCPLKRHLKQRMRHSTQKCQRRFSYYQKYPYDQRPTCNSGNICEDTYDELKLLRAPPAERSRVYCYMFQRRKHLLNQPYDQSPTAEQKIKR